MAAVPMRSYVPTRSRVRLADVWSTARVARMIGRRDIRIKYRQSALGPLWLILQPLGVLGAVVVAFAGVTHVDTGGVPYVLFALVGIAVWTYVQLTITLSASAIVSNSSLVRRSTCPRVALINAALLTNLPTLALMTAISLVVAIADGGIEPQMLLLPLMVAWLVAFAWGPALIFASIAARFRDAVAVVPLFIQAGVFVSPVGYPVGQAPHGLRILLSVNPVSGLIEAWRWCMLGTYPLVLPLVMGGVWTVVLAAVGWRLFARFETQFADFL